MPTSCVPAPGPIRASIRIYSTKLKRSTYWDLLRKYRRSVREKYGDSPFDYVISSHNLEHLPDPIKFLKGCQDVLTPDGVLAFAIPDRRYCFDFYRPATDASEWLEAFYTGRTQPSPAQVFRHSAFESLLDGRLAWSLPELTKYPEPTNNLMSAHQEWLSTTILDGAPPAYRDVHCWAFTPTSFELVLRDLQFLGVIHLEIVEVTQTNGFEFYAHLRNRPAQSPTSTESEYATLRAELLRRTARESEIAVDALAIHNPARTYKYGLKRAKRRIKWMRDRARPGQTFSRSRAR